MKISTRGEYGLRAMLYIASHGQDDPVTSKEIALHQAIPGPYLRQILALLSKDHLIQSNRGPQGGHLLARSADAITLRDILITLEGQTTSVDQILALPCNIEVGPEHCVIREVFLKVKQAVNNILGGTTLAQLMERQQEILDKKIQVPSDLATDGGQPAVLHVLPS